MGQDRAPRKAGTGHENQIRFGERPTSSEEPAAAPKTTQRGKMKPRERGHQGKDPRKEMGKPLKRGGKRKNFRRSQGWLLNTKVKKMGYRAGGKEKKRRAGDRGF